MCDFAIYNGLSHFSATQPPPRIGQQKAENIMSQAVSRESLNALANVAMTSILTGDRDEHRVEHALADGGAAEALAKVLDRDYNAARFSPFFEGYLAGAELGINIAAAVASNPLDLSALRDAITAEIVASSAYWPEGCLKPAEAA
jgi:hypothetical protein